MTHSEEERVQALLAEGWGFLRTGRSGEALHAFGRILLQDPHHSEARRGLEHARGAVAEQERLVEMSLDDARRAVEAGEPELALPLLERVVALGGRDIARGMLDRLGVPAVEPCPPDPPPAAAPAAAEPDPAGSPWPRRTFVMGWAFVFALLGGGLVLSWERLIERLVRTPGRGDSPQ